jgi:hypothetical protein
MDPTGVLIKRHGIILRSHFGSENTDDIWNTTQIVIIMFEFISRYDKIISIKLSINHQEMIKFRRNWFKKEMKHYGLRFIKSLILFAIIENCLSSGKSIAPIYKNGDKTDCNNNRGMSLLSTSYDILSNILLSMLRPYIDEIIGDRQCVFRRNRSITDHIFCIRHILEKRKWEYNDTVDQLFIDFKKAYDSVRMKILYNIAIEFGLPMKLVRFIRCV